MMWAILFVRLLCGDGAMTTGRRRFRGMNRFLRLDFGGR